MNPIRRLNSLIKCLSVCSLMLFASTGSGHASWQSIQPQSPVGDVEVSLIVADTKEVLAKVLMRPGNPKTVRALKFPEGSDLMPDVGVAQIRYEHKKPENIQVILRTNRGRSVSVNVIAVHPSGKIDNLHEGSWLDEFNDSQTLPVNGEMRYVVALLPEHLEMTFNEGLAVGRDSKRIAGASMMTNLGAVYGQRGEYVRSVEFYELSLLLAKTKGVAAEAAAHNNLGLAHYAFSRYDKAVESYHQALKLLEELPITSRTRLAGEATTFDNLGQVQNALARFDLGLKYYEKSLQLKRKIGDKQGEFLVLNNLGSSFNMPGKYEIAIRYYRQALLLARRAQDQRGEGVMLNNLAAAYRAQGKFSEAEPLIHRSLTLSRTSKNSIARAFALNNLGLLNTGRGNLVEAIKLYQQALEIYRESYNRSAQAVALNNLLFAYGSLKQNNLAIFYGKQSVNILQELRAEVSKLDKATQTSFLQSRTDTYRRLVDLLVSESRLPEAQMVLDLLKEEEFSKLLRRNGNPETVIPYSNAEEAVLKILDKLAALGREKSYLEESLTIAADRQRFRQVQKEIETTEAEFNRTLSALSAAAMGQNFDVVVKDAQAFMEDLRDLGKGTVALYTVIVTEEPEGPKTAGQSAQKIKTGWIILVTPEFRKAYPIDVKDLEKTVFSFREALRTDSYDPLPLAQELHRKLFLQTSEKQKVTLAADLETYLSTHENKTLMWFLDGVLRYVPIAALHDGKNYLVERYRNTVFNTASKARLKDEPSPKWTALGFGVSKERVEAGKTFAALPGASRELHAIIHDAAAKNNEGILPGSVKLDDQFTDEAMYEGLLDRPPVLHIASHFSYQPADFDGSFLLLGSGRLTVKELSGRSTLFSSVDLLTLSACDTAVGSANGQEIEGFAYLAQSLGAKAVLASLWPVSDEGTSELMLRFYSLRASNPQLSKAEVLRRAQLSLLRGEANEITGGAGTSRAESAFRSNTQLNLALYQFNPQKPFAHPHYWAPFILIGNWK